MPSTSRPSGSRSCRQLKKQLDAEVQQLSQNYSSFKLAQSRLSESENALEAIDPENADNEILIPLSQSLYVPGKLANADTVLVDVGTGYFFEKSVKQAREFFSGKVNVIQENADALEKIIRQKRKQSQTVLQVLQQRIAEATAGGPSQ
jgi:prefoldin alpha subunit